MKAKVEALVEDKQFQGFIMILILVNSIIMGLETSKYLMDNYGVFLVGVDTIILYCFVIELLLRLYAARLKFFTSPWCMFDLIVVTIGLVPVTESFATLRALRVLRILRLISINPAMRRVVEGLLLSIPGIAAVISIMTLFFYVFAVIGTHLYGANFPVWFGTLGKTMFTLFQIMTLESWSMGIVRPVMELHPYAWVFFILYIMIATFTILNLFIAIIVNAMKDDTEAVAAKHRQELKEELSLQLRESEDRLLAEMKRQNKPSIE